MWIAASLLLCLTLLQVSSTWCSDVRYASVGGEERHSGVILNHGRFTRAEEGNKTISDKHIYYTSTYYPAGDPVVSSLWQDLAGMVDDVVVDNLTIVSDLSGLHRYYQVHGLKFEFPFYGHTITSLAVTTGGFLYTGDLLHEFVAATQFIAPLQADFNPSKNESGRVLILSTENQFTVQWDKVHNHDHVTDGTFTFQVSIFPSGEMHFVYQEIPLQVDMINNDDHPVEIGLADAFYIFEYFPDGIYVTVYEYHRISLNSSLELSNSAYIIKPELNCVAARSCEQCFNISYDSDFDCGWCNKLNRCSDGLDRHRQEWFESGCDEKQTTDSEPETKSSGLSASSKAGIAVGVLVLVICASLLLLLMTLFLYGYRKPNSKLGQLMIKYRPKALSLNKTSDTSYKVSSEKAALEEGTY